MSVQFGLLGEIQARVAGVAVDLGHSRQRCVLAALLVEPNRAQPLDVLVERVWGGQAPRQARGTLYGYLYRLRQAFADVPEVTIDRTPGGYLLPVDEDAVDLHRFRLLVKRSRTEDGEAALALAEQALGLWRGTALGGADGAWVDAVRRTLDRERWAAQLHHNDIALRLGRHAGLVADLSTLVEENPLDERLVGQLILALYRSGRQADALEHYQRTRQRLAEELGADPAPALRDLHQRILTADPALSPAREQAATTPPPVPRQLPPAPPQLTGRTAELAALAAADCAPPEAAGAPATVAISVIAGAGGIGKTWLALHWAHQQADRFPDGQLFVDLHGFSPTANPMDPSTALRGFLDALGVDPQSVPHDPHAQSALFRSLVSDRRMLIVIDNARDADQVVPLLPGSPTCTVVVTSRNRLTELLTRHGARPLRVDPLGPVEAADVLTAWLGGRRVAAEPAAVKEMLACCNGLPLALSIVAGRAAAYPEFPLAAMAAELLDATTRLDALADDSTAASLPAVLSWSHHALSAEQVRVFALLGLSSGPDIGLPAATALAGLPAPATRTVLRALEDMHLVRQHTPGRWRMHDLIHLYAVDRARHDLAEADRQAAQRRLVDFYLHTAHAADRLLNPHRDPIRLDEPVPDCRPHPLADQSAALEWISAEHGNLSAAQRLAADHGWHPPVWQLAWALDSFHSRRGRLPDKVTMWRAGLPAAERHDDPAVRALARRCLGVAAAYAGSTGEALRHLDQALELAEHIGDRTSQAHIHRALAWAWERQGRTDSALRHATHALRLFQDLDSQEWEAAALNAVGWYEAQQGDYDEARAHCEAALDLARRRRHRQVEAVTRDSLGLIARLTGNHTEALDHYRLAVGLCRDLGHTYDEADVFDGLGHTHFALGDREATRTAWRQALKLYETQHRAADAERVRQQLDGLRTPLKSGAASRST
ncbi:AfsR/SARP family transcriptional regulator [Actinosynnema sp. CS-041913]|uniref:AfsR/SARP family transcriptional regulator n=1 Tax=Actinosynnema sp. CS-041913 TaxID=3239917 RepID=UPI003D8FC3C7